MPPEASASVRAAITPRQRLRRLPGRTPSVRLSRAEASARLWIGDGELVQETVRSHTQEIQRFAFADIQAIQIRRTVRGVVYNAVLGTLLMVVFLFTLTADRRTETQWIVIGCFVLPLLILLFINVLRGATCRTLLTTALGPQHLLSLSRMRQARRALDTIIADVDAVQGALQPDEAARQVDQAQMPHRPPASPPPGVTLPGYRY